MKYRLGLDLGTNSIGWCVYSLDDDNRPVNLENLGVRIFSDGRDPKSKEPLAVERRTARGQRRLIHRRKQRRRATFRLLQKEGLFPLAKEEAQKLKLLNPYELRIKGLDERLEPFELGRVLFSLSVRRGFKSNRKDGSQEEKKENSKSEKMTQGDKCKNLENTIKEFGCRTLGEFLWNNRELNHGIRFVPGRMEYYPTRQLYIDEFNLIRQKQEEFYPQVDWDAICEQLFFQRPLRPQERGRCQYMPENERTFKAMPCAHRIRILQDVYNLSFIAKGKQHNLLPEWRDELIQLLDSKEKVKFSDMRKKLGLDADITFNLESEAREFLHGNATAVKLRSKNRFGELWDTLSLKEQDDIVETLITAEDDDTVMKLLGAYTLSAEQKNAIVKLVFASGTTSLCREFTEQVIEEIEQKQCQIHQAIANLGYDYAAQTVEKFDELPYYGKVLVGSTMGIKANPKNVEDEFGKIANPTVHIALNQTRVVVNALIKEYGRPTQVVIEVSRDLKASREAKDRIQKQITENQKRNARLNESIKVANPRILFPNRTDRLKFKLWEDLNPGDSLRRHCIYCGKQISGADIFDDNLVQIEHILPFSRTLWDSEHNKTVAHTKCNAAKGERSPFEAFGSNPPGYDWNGILERASRLADPQKRKLFSENAMDTFEKDNCFIARQLTDNAYLSKMALRYLRAVVDKDSDVWCVTGGMTKLLRDEWEIDSILKRKIGDAEIAHFGLKGDQIGIYKKNRYDHRHHALDACVIALIDRGLVKEISTKNARRQRNRIEVPQMPVLRHELVDRVKHIVVSHKPDHGPEGKLSKKTLLGKIKWPRQVDISEIKTEQDISLIRNDRVRSDFEAKLKETGDVKKTVQALKEVYPTLWLYEELFVSREFVALLKGKDIDSVVDRKIQERLKAFIAEHSGEKIEEVMQQFSTQTGIKKVRCKNQEQKVITITNSDNTKRYLCTEDYLLAIIWEIPPKKEGGKVSFAASYIRRDEVDSKSNIKDEKKPHPAARKIGVLHKNDCIEFIDNGIYFKGRIVGLKGDGRVDCRPIFSVTDCKDWMIATQNEMTESCWVKKDKKTNEIKYQEGKNYVSVNVLFGEKQARLITVNPIGKVFRKK
ncbi:MAG: type II CRISPR RNA-guided endonuclease Cas9 [Spirochaetaceae bacterium]|nr:type II CRISPR RNA-guided endonuclease Cas9 [Spirochaetaceae bacterium]